MQSSAKEAIWPMTPKTRTNAFGKWARAVGLPRRTIELPAAVRRCVVMHAIAKNVLRDMDICPVAQCIWMMVDNVYLGSCFCIAISFSIRNLLKFVIFRKKSCVWIHYIVCLKLCFVYNVLVLLKSSSDQHTRNGSMFRFRGSPKCRPEHCRAS